MIAEHMISVLREARAEVERLKKEIHEEMCARAREGRLWTNGQCAAWPAYEAALEKLQAERDGFST